ncbi:hypothetical protein [Prevotellamassilia timonensis]|uniref:hypothetical protein n=1 Tax=Prevotellamassilia timonensis TaxID=1852370 RepID=UPI003FF08B98
MKSIFLYLSIVVCLLANFSCGNHSKTENAKKEVDTIWNEKVQDTFFGATFGDSVPKVIDQLSANGFYLVEDVSSESLLHFRARQGKYFTFGNMTWEMLDIGAENGIFNYIRFVNAREDKASALSAYNSLKNTIAAKYDLTEPTIQDTTVYAKSSIFGKNQTRAQVSCFRYETINNNIMIAVSLDYWSNKPFTSVSDDL